MIVYTKASSEKELKQILGLQRKNLPKDLSNEEKSNEGFLTVEHTLEILKKMNDYCPHSIAKYNDKVVGFALPMTKDIGDEITVLKPMFYQINQIISDEKYMVMGQICIEKEFRKKGIFRGLYQFMKTDICPNKFDLIITEIDINNHRSINAHKSVGFTKMKDYKFEDKNWRIVSLKI
jgi:hypothetical protein